MDIIIDTNIIKQENYFRSKKFLILMDYLRKTNSKIVLSQIVKEESISLYETDISSKLIEATNQIKDFSRICFTPVVIDLNIEVKKEVNSYIAYIQELSTEKLLYEIPYTNDFLPEVVYRMISRKKPCSNKGEECRDVILWLSIKKLLKNKKSVAFISNNSNEFSSNKTDLHTDLRSELVKENLELKYYLNLNDFLKNHAEKVDYITKDWITDELSKSDLENFIWTYLIDNGLLLFWAEEKIDDKCYNADPIGISTEIDDFYVYEMTNGDIFLNVVLCLVMEIEANFRTIWKKTFEKTTYLELSAKITNEELKELEVIQQYS